MSDDNEDDYEDDGTIYQVWPGDTVSLNLINSGYVTNITGRVIGVKSEAYLDLDVISVEGDDIGYRVEETLLIEISGVGWIDVTDLPIIKLDQTEEEDE